MDCNKSAIKWLHSKDKGQSDQLRERKSRVLIPPDFVRLTSHSRVILMYHIWLVHLLQLKVLAIDLAVSMRFHL